MTATFESKIERLEDGLRFHCFPIPEPLGGELWDSGVRRFLVSFGKTEKLSRGIQGPDGARHFVVGKTFLDGSGTKLGSAVSVRIEPDPNPDCIELCKEFEITLAEDAEARERWDEMTPGMQRSLAHYLNTAKKPETRVKRALEVAEKLRTRTLYGD